MSDDESEGLLHRHRVLPHVRSRVAETNGDAKEGQRDVMMVGRDAAVSLLQIMQSSSLDRLKARLGSKPHSYKSIAKAIRKEIAASPDETRPDLPFSATPSTDSIPHVIGHDAQVDAVVRAADNMGIGRVTWEDVLTFLIEAGMKGRSSDLVATFKGFSEILEYNGARLTSMQSLRYLPTVQKVIGCTGHALQWISPETDYDVTGPTMCLSQGEGRASNLAILSFDYLPVYQCVAAGCGDLTLVLFKALTGVVVDSHTVEATMTTVRCMNDKLYSGDRDGIVYFWRVRREHPSGLGTEKAKAGNIALGTIPRLSLIRKIALHESPVSDIASVHAQSCLASCGDHLIVIMTPKGEILRKLRHASSGPITGLAYSLETNLLISHGSASDPLVWHITNTDTTKPFPLIDAMKPHVGALSGLCTVSGTTQCVSCDMRGMIKIWCLVSVSCLQTLQCGTAVGVLNASKQQYTPLRALTVIPEKRQILAANALRAWIFEYDACVGASLGLRQSAHDNSVASMHYNAADTTIVTASGAGVSVWSLETGQQLARYSLEQEVNAIALTEDGTQFIAGSANGKLSVYNVSSGNKIRDLPDNHESDITSVTVCAGKRAILTTAWDGTVFLSTLDDYRHPSAAEAGGSSGPAWAPDSGSPAAGAKVKNIHEKTVDGKCADYSKEFALCAIGDGKDSVTLWSTTKDKVIDLRPFAKCQPESAALNTEAASLREITCVHFVYDLPALVSSNSVGDVYLWSISPYPYPNQCLAWWTNSAKKTMVDKSSAAGIETTASVNVGVVALALMTARVEDDMRERPSFAGPLFSAGSDAFLTEVPATGRTAAAAPGDETILLYTGDDEGYLCSYNLGIVLAEYSLPLPPGVTFDSMQTTPAMYPEPAGRVVHRVKRWRAHAGGISCVTPVQDHNLLVTSGSDRQVSVWTMMGVHVGCFDQNAMAAYTAMKPLRSVVRSKSKSGKASGCLQLCDVPGYALLPADGEQRRAGTGLSAEMVDEDESAAGSAFESPRDYPSHSRSSLKLQAKYRFSQGSPVHGPADHNRRRNSVASCRTATRRSLQAGGTGLPRALRHPSGFDASSTVANSVKFNVPDDTVGTATATGKQGLRAASRSQDASRSGKSSTPSRSQRSKGRGGGLVSPPMSPLSDESFSFNHAQFRSRAKSTLNGSVSNAGGKPPPLPPHLHTQASTVSRLSAGKSGRLNPHHATSPALSSQSRRMSSFARAGVESARFLPEGYLNMLSCDASHDGPRASAISRNADDSPSADQLLSPSLTPLPSGSLEYHSKSKRPQKEVVQVEVTNRLTGQSRVLLLDNKKPARPAAGEPADEGVGEDVLSPPSRFWL
ncbi:Vegetative incompatibility protein HET-E-1 [Diplonema papillatum]|nr:Vegetative incompatibility protein HET-E-1 [Diplonema papillatum]KAJ9460808.1 Vegetative incompatibility protein HET-E-1 [Diplonema papillatum]